MIPVIVLNIQYQVIYNQSNLSFQTYFEEFIYIKSKFFKVNVENVGLYIQVYKWNFNLRRRDTNNYQNMFVCVICISFIHP